MSTCECDERMVDVRKPSHADLGIPGGGFVDGEWITQELELEVSDPEDGRTIASVFQGGIIDIDRAIAGVARSLKHDTWEVWKRRETLERAAVIVREESARLARIISAESSKTITEAARESERTAETLRLSAASAHLLEGETLALADTPRGVGCLGWNRRTPLGIIAAITPFNDPMNLVAHKIGPALMAGNVVVLKPAKSTPLSALALLEILLRAGMPPGRIAVLTMDREAGTALINDSRIAAISFTGGPATGDTLARAAGARKILMELGGNNAVVVCADGDVVRAAAGIVDGSFGVAGQNCLSVQRVYAHASVYEELIDCVVDGTRQLRLGSKREITTDIGPMIAESEAIRVENWIAEATACGARIATGGERNGAFLAPTVLLDVPEESRVMHEEVFGPVVSIVPFRDLSEALEAVDSTEYGLQTGLFTASMATAMDAVEHLNVGSVLINETSDFRIDSMPFGGSKRSGVGREGVASAVLEMSEPKNVIINCRP